MPEAPSACTRQRPSALDKTTGSPDKAFGATANGTRPGCMDSADLLRGQKTVEIKHNGSTYRLQATRLGKLILTK
jgi:hemin uptake protein HemP